MERAALVNKHHIKRSKTITKDTPGIEHLIEGSIDADDTAGFTKRMLLSAVVDVSQLAENVERIKVTVFTLAKAHGIVPPKG